ncbi:uncharacterized protein LOC111711101 [Eurytemora carolleeae]|uniref:uncharacterized protein LOC111711101 n=1 Tax=Eurytemora carolleeae TaxID=1294199 RepID=UPI000C790816|nr:uncharacterized protein LOC111711101 [Eurytemora carolleeae]|eukprot:XP_023341120.1 uncharacterized protein LOC111711101 [Eurytemora affinis]
MSLSIRMLGLYALYPLLEVHAKNGGSNSIRGRSGTGVVEGKGGNGGTSEEEKVVHTDGLSWWGILLLTLAIVIFIFIIVKCCVEFQDAYFGGGRKVCYLCLDKIRIQDWNSGEHRRQCAFRYASDLTNLLQHDRVKCPKCESRLRLWPEGRGPSFSCDSDDSLECADKGSQIKNNGKNRYNCFLCDYDLCESCVQKMSEKLEKSDCISVHWSNHGSSRKSSSSEFAQQVSAELLRKCSKDGTIRIDFVNDGKRRYSKDTHSNDQRRFSHEIRKEARRPSHAGLVF